MENQAFSIEITKRGGPAVLQKRPLPVPRPGPEDVVVEIEAAGVAFADIVMREGLYPDAPPFPFVPGYDCVGKITDRGESVTNLEIGQRVGALTRTGSYATHIALPASRVAPCPATVDAAQAVSLILNYLTAWQMLTRSARMVAGERVLVHGGGGGVGTALLECAKLLDLEAWATVSPAKRHLVEARDATPIDYRSEDFVQTIQAAGGADAVFDAIGGDHWNASFAALRPGGRLVAYGLSSAFRNGRRHLPSAIRALLKQPKPGGTTLMERNAGFLGYDVWRLSQARPDWYRADLENLFELLALGKLHPEVADRIPLAEATRAHERLGAGEIAGKLVLIPSG